MIYLILLNQSRLSKANPIFFLLFLFHRLLQLLLETDRMWMTKVVALCLLALVASAEDKKLSSHATTLAGNSANLAFRSVNLIIMVYITMVIHLESKAA